LLPGLAIPPFILLRPLQRLHPVFLQHERRIEMRSQRLRLVILLLVLSALLLGCIIGSSKPVPKEPLTWKLVGVGDCTGHDEDGFTEGAFPYDSKAQAGYTAVCWDTVNYTNQGQPDRAFCTYKKIAYSDCTGGGNPGEMYTAVSK
jgi:hypothetical protein